MKITIEIPDDKPAHCGNIFNRIRASLRDIYGEFNEQGMTFTIPAKPPEPVKVPLGPNRTRDGRKARVICIDRGRVDGTVSVVALIEVPNTAQEEVSTYYQDGRFTNRDDPRDLIGHLPTPDWKPRFEDGWTYWRKGDEWQASNGTELQSWHVPAGTPIQNGSWSFAGLHSKPWKEGFEQVHPAPAKPWEGKLWVKPNDIPIHYSGRDDCEGLKAAGWRLIDVKEVLP